MGITAGLLVSIRCRSDWRRGLERYASGKLEGTRRQLACNPDERLTETCARSSSVPIRSAVTDKVRVVEDVERFRAKMQDHSFVGNSERALQEGRHVIHSAA